MHSGDCKKTDTRWEPSHSGLPASWSQVFVARQRPWLIVAELAALARLWLYYPVTPGKRGSAQQGTDMPHAIIRGANGRRHEVDFEDAEVTIEVFSGETTIEIVIEAPNDLVPSEHKRFALVNLPRKQFSAALGQAAQRKSATKTRAVS